MISNWRHFSSRDIVYRYPQQLTQCHFSFQYTVHNLRTKQFITYIDVHYVHRRGRGGVAPPRIFINGTNIVDRGLKVLFFGLLLFFGIFFRCPHSRKRLNSAIFRYFLLNFRYFFHCSPSPWKIFCRRSWLRTVKYCSKSSYRALFKSTECHSSIWGYNHTFYHTFYSFVYRKEVCTLKVSAQQRKQLHKCFWCQHRHRLQQKVKLRNVYSAVGVRDAGDASVSRSQFFG